MAQRCEVVYEDWEATALALGFRRVKFAAILLDSAAKSSLARGELPPRFLLMQPEYYDQLARQAKALGLSRAAIEWPGYKPQYLREDPGPQPLQRRWSE